MSNLAEEMADLLLVVAYSLAHQHRLEADGVIHCWNCSGRKALMPSLHCAVCLADAWRRTGASMLCPNREQTPDDIEALALMRGGSNTQK